MSKKAKPPKQSGQVLPFPKQWRPPSLSSLPKGKQRWLRRATRAVLDDARKNDPREKADAIRVSVALAFTSNRRGEAAESEVMAWMNDHFAEVNAIAFDLVEEAAPEAAREARMMMQGGAL